MAKNRYEYNGGKIHAYNTDEYYYGKPKQKTVRAYNPEIEKQKRRKEVQKKMQRREKGEEVRYTQKGGVHPKKIKKQKSNRGKRKTIAGFLTFVATLGLFSRNGKWKNGR